MIFDFTDYKRFLQAWMASMPKKGRGQARKLAEHLGVHPVVVSQILSGSRDLSHEQALDVAVYLGLDERATEYFSTMVLKARAGTKRLEEHLKKKLDGLRHEAKLLKNRISTHKKLNEENLGVFYSNWFYSGVRLLSSVPGFDNIEAIAAHYRLGRAQVNTIMAYLVSYGLCVQDDRGRYSMGTTSTFIDRNSPFINGHHRNWRMKAVEKLIQPKETDMFYTNPCSLSAADKELFREELKKLIAGFSKRVQDSPAEQVSCLNIDWFDV
ncbi:MAG: TIGR02147 family protein [Bdellovibrionota bacterium]